MLRSAIWTFIAILAPEVLLADAMTSYADVVLARRKLDVQGRTRLSKKHLAFAEMGGFVIRCKHSDLVYRTETSDTTSREAKQDFFLTAASLCFAVKAGWVDKSLPTKADITDKSKSDLFAIILSVAQLLYFLLRIIIRKVHRLPLS